MKLASTAWFVIEIVFRPLIWRRSGVVRETASFGMASAQLGGMIEKRHILATAITFVALLFTAACADDSAQEIHDGADDAFLVSGKADVPNTIHENTPEARAILRVVNTYSRHKLIEKTDLYWRSAAEITDFREGPDGKIGTDDDRVVFTLSELDAVPYVGKTAFQRLRRYVNENDLIIWDEVKISNEIPEQVETLTSTLVRQEIAPKGRIEIPLTGVQGDRLLLMLRKISDARWNPKLSIRDRDGKVLTAVNPWGTADARIPQLNDEIGRGWEIGEVTDLVVVLENTNDVAGQFEFSLDCVGGPCYADKAPHRVTEDEILSLHDDALRAALVEVHQESHLRISYYDARMEMFSSLDNVNGQVECVYTHTWVQTDKIPSNLKMNAEHTWPQSMGAVDGAARSDLHHIFPVTSLVNSTRGNAPYCDVVEVIREVDGALLGYDENGKRCFEPADSHKGNAARAMFYFATIYQQPIADDEEALLRKWASQDPIDAPERIRAERIEVFQGSVQPFIKWPQLLGQIQNF
ncbi:MAG: endonuclease [bacterium]